MGGCSVEHDPELVSALTLVLVGKTGNGKSATGNSILGTEIFESKRSSSGVTTTSELKTIRLEDGAMLNVIDTPGMFDSSADPEFIRKEIVKSLHMVRDGIHAVLVVFSICNRFSEEEQAVICSLVTLFGSKIYDYIVIVFTGGDELEQEGNSLEGFLCKCPESLKKNLDLCGNRCVLFDNRTKDEVKKSSQLQKLFSFVDMVLETNDGKPYTNEIFAELKELQLTETQFKRIIELFESRFTEIELKLQKLLEEERVARQEAESNAREKQNKYQEEVERLKDELAKAQALSPGKNWCAII